MRCAVLGSGSWGTALAIQLARSGDDVWVWSRTEEAASTIQRSRENARYLPGGTDERRRAPPFVSRSPGPADVHMGEPPHRT